MISKMKIGKSCEHVGPHSCHMHRRQHESGAVKNTKSEVQTGIESTGVDEIYDSSYLSLFQPQKHPPSDDTIRRVSYIQSLLLLEA